MKTRDKQLGQTLIETTFILALILLILFGIAEFARAWFLKNSLNNAARIGARFAVVHDNLVPNDTDVIDVVNESPGVPSGADLSQEVVVEVFICDKTETDCDSETSSKSNAETGDIIRVTVTVNFKTSDGTGEGQFSVFASFIPGLSGGLDSLSSRASMRYEL